MDFWSLWPTRVPLLTARHKALRIALARQQLHWTVDDWKHVSSSDESRSNCIGQMDAYEYGDNLMNTWTLHVNKGLFILVKSLGSALLT